MDELTWFVPKTSCGYCSGSIFHEDWCVAVNINVNEAWGMIHTGFTSQTDAAILKDLGVSW